MHGSDRLAFGFLAAALATTLVSVGGALRWGACLAAVVAIAGAALVLRRTSRRLESLPPLLALIGLAAALTALQLVPLPAGLVRLIAPATHEIVAGAAETLGRPEPGWMPISLDWPRTLVELAKLLGYAAFALLALRVAASRRGRRGLLMLVAGFGACLALVGIAHHLVEARRLFGVYTPDQATRPFLSPLINASHYAGLLAMSVPAALALAFEGRGWARPAWLGAAGASTGVCLALLSRGGAIALGIGVVVGGVLAVSSLGEPDRSRETRRRVLVTTLPGVIAAACGLVLVALYSSSGVARMLSETSFDEVNHPASKFAAWRSAAELLSDHRWTGIGRGAFETAFTRVHPASDRQIYAYAENEYLQAALDWGIIGAAALAVAFGWLAVAALRRSRDGPLAAAAFGGVLAIALLAVVDFGLEMPAVAMPAVALASALTYVPLDRTRGRYSPRARLVVAVGAVAAAGIATVAAGPPGRSAREDGARLAIAAHHAADDPAAVLADASVAMRRHPADYYAPALVARYLLARGDTSAARFLNRALLLHPTHAGLHHLAARMLARAGRPAQARLEYAAAIRHARDPEPLVDEVLHALGAEADIVDALPREAPLAGRVVPILLDRRREDVAIAYLERMLARQPDDETLLSLLFGAARRANRADVAESAARAVLARSPNDPIAADLAAVLVAAGRPADAAAIVEAALAVSASGPQHARLLSVLADVRIAERRHADAREALHRALEITRDPAEQAALHRRLAEVETALGNAHQAAWELARARELQP